MLRVRRRSLLKLLRSSSAGLPGGGTFADIWRNQAQCGCGIGDTGVNEAPRSSRSLAPGILRRAYAGVPAMQVDPHARAGPPIRANPASKDSSSTFESPGKRHGREQGPWEQARVLFGPSVREGDVSALASAVAAWAAGPGRHRRSAVAMRVALEAAGSAAHLGGLSAAHLLRAVADVEAQRPRDRRFPTLATASRDAALQLARVAADFARGVPGTELSLTAAAGAASALVSLRLPVPEALWQALVEGVRVGCWPQTPEAALPVIAAAWEAAVGSGVVGERALPVRAASQGAAGRASDYDGSATQSLPQSVLPDLHRALCACAGHLASRRGSRGAAFALAPAPVAALFEAVARTSHSPSEEIWSALVALLRRAMDDLSTVDVMRVLASADGVRKAKGPRLPGGTLRGLEFAVLQHLERGVGELEGLRGQGRGVGEQGGMTRRDEEASASMPAGTAMESTAEEEEEAGARVVTDEHGRKGTATGAAQGGLGWVARLRGQSKIDAEAALVEVAECARALVFLSRQGHALSTQAAAAATRLLKGPALPALGPRAVATLLNSLRVSGHQAPPAVLAATEPVLVRACHQFPGAANLVMGLWQHWSHSPDKESLRAAWTALHVQLSSVGQPGTIAGHLALLNSFKVRVPEDMLLQMEARLTEVLGTHRGTLDVTTVRRITTSWHVMGYKPSESLARDLWAKHVVTNLEAFRPEELVPVLQAFSKHLLPREAFLPSELAAVEARVVSGTRSALTQGVAKEGAAAAPAADGDLLQAPGAATASASEELRAGKQGAARGRARRGRRSPEAQAHWLRVRTAEALVSLGHEIGLELTEVLNQGLSGSTTFDKGQPKRARKKGQKAAGGGQGVGAEMGDGSARDEPGESLDLQKTGRWAPLERGELERLRGGRAGEGNGAL